MTKRLGIALLLAGCSPAEPQGQVLAVVDGTDITRRDVQAEARASGLIESASADARLRAALVDRLVDRALLVKAAQARGLDRTPDYLAAVRRARALALVESLRADILSHVPVPSAAAIADHIARNPWRFARRTVLYGRRAATSSGDPARGAPFVLETGALTPADAERLAALPLGTATLLNGTPVVIERRVPAPLVGSEASIQAAATLRTAAVDRYAFKILQNQRLAVMIKFQQGLGPAAPAP